ncbi:hypothetical protein FOL47_000614 [Perkinsus chesapeaki]|uniref:HTH OST-type domain-containing protein n=1 Tax=Perkinsus chesapeaki TaxID=330153 RepID=A0A7J6ML99_PERCH|nr:hypothetical protein FOL47_000614 [Perkinsus chesapeaki]
MTLREQIKRTIISLYNDRIYPDFQSVKKRHEERYKAEPLTLDTLMHLCNQNNPDFSIEKAEERPVPGFRLAHPPKSFRGFVSPTLWDAFETEINSLMLYEPSCYTFPGGRYGTARALKERNLRFLNGYSLGELCHIPLPRGDDHSELRAQVQLAIDKEILAYGKSGSVVPFKVSSKAEKDANARDKKPTFAGHRRQVAKEGSEQSRRDTTDSSGGDHCSSHHSGSSHLSPRSEPAKEDFIASWGRLREVLFTLLTTTEWKHRILLLSNLKNEIRRHFSGVVLSETALGHTKLIDMVQDPNLADLVRVDWRRNNPVLKLEPGATLKRGPTGISIDSPKDVASVATPERCAESLVETTGPDSSINTVSPLDRAIEIDAKRRQDHHHHPQHGPVISLKNTFLQYAHSEEAEGLQKSRRVKTAPDEYLLSTADRAITGLHINHYQITPLDFPFIPSAATETDYDLTNATDGASIVPPPPGLDATVAPLSPLPALAHPNNGVSDALATFGSSTDLTDALPDLELLLSQISSDPPLTAIGGTTLNASAAEFVPMRSQTPRPSSDAFAQYIFKGLPSNSMTSNQLPPTPAAASHGIQMPITPGGILLTQAMTEVEAHAPPYPWMSRTPGGYTIGTLFDACGSPTGAMATESCEEVLRSPLRVTPHHHA